MLSVVVASRNDGHGLHLLARTQVFIDGLADQVERFGRAVELIIVEWNPPEGSAALCDVLICPAVNGLTARVITVPRDVHSNLDGSEHLSFYQMIAKNVGIRRATGDAVLATNIDILLSDDVFLDSTQMLRDQCVYRADRADIPFDPEMAAHPQMLRRTLPIRLNRKTGIYYPGRGRTYPHVRGVGDLVSVFAHDPVGFVQRAMRWSANSGPPGISRYRRAFRQIVVLPRLHLNGCGDFTLMTRNSWAHIRGYPEWEMFSWNLDSLLLYQAAAAGFAFIEFDDHPAFHLEHSAGWSPESHVTLFERLDRDGIPVLTDPALTDVASSIWRERRTGRWRTNLPMWGMADIEFMEVRLDGGTRRTSGRF